MTATEPLETQTRACGTCGKTFEAPLCRNPFAPESVLAVARHCGPCVAAENERMAKSRDARDREAREARLAEAWGRICPLQHRTPLEGGTTDIDRLGRELPQLGEILDHPLGTQGLILRGRTGAGKTRAMFRLLRRYFVGAARPSIVAMSAGEFDRQARDAAGNFTLTEWFDRLAAVDCLFIDDIGKGKWTPATSGWFWELVDARTKHQRPLFLTTNFSGQQLVSVLKLDGDTAAPLLRRLRENCKVIVCGGQPTKQEGPAIERKQAKETFSPVESITTAETPC